MPPTTLLKKPFSAAVMGTKGTNNQQQHSRTAGGGNNNLQQAPLTSPLHPTSGRYPESPLSFDITHAASFPLGESPMKGGGGGGYHQSHHHNAATSSGLSPHNAANNSSGNGLISIRSEDSLVSLRESGDVRAATPPPASGAAASSFRGGDGGSATNYRDTTNFTGSYGGVASPINSKYVATHHHDDDDDDSAGFDVNIQKLLDGLGDDDCYEEGSSDDGDGQTSSSVHTTITVPSDRIYAKAAAGGTAPKTYTMYPAAPAAINNRGSYSNAADSKTAGGRNGSNKRGGVGGSGNANAKGGGALLANARSPPFSATNNNNNSSSLFEVEVSRAAATGGVPTSTINVLPRYDTAATGSPALPPTPAATGSKGPPSYSAAVSHHTTPQMTPARSTGGPVPAIESQSPMASYGAPPHLPPPVGSTPTTNDESLIHTFTSAVEQRINVDDGPSAQHGGGGGSSSHQKVVNGEYLLVRNLGGVFLLRPVGPSADNAQHPLPSGGALNGSPIPNAAGNNNNNGNGTSGALGASSTRSPLQGAVSVSPSLTPSVVPGVGGSRGGGAGVGGSRDIGSRGGTSIPSSPTPSVTLPDYSFAVLHHSDHHHPLPPPSYPGGPLGFRPTSTPPLSAVTGMSGARGGGASAGRGGKALSGTPVLHHSLPSHTVPASQSPQGGSVPNRSFTGTGGFSPSLPPPPAYPDGINSSHNHHHHHARHTNPTSLLPHRSSGPAAALPPPSYTQLQRTGGGPPARSPAPGASPTLSGEAAPIASLLHGTSPLTSAVSPLHSFSGLPATMSLPPPAYPGANNAAGTSPTVSHNVSVSSIPIATAGGGAPLLPPYVA